MSFFQENIVYIWLLPVIVHIVLPLSMLVISLIKDLLSNQNKSQHA